MILVSDVLEDADQRVASSFNPAMKIRWLNHVVGYLWREIELPKQAIIETVAGEALYPLPSDCVPNKIRIIKVDGYEVPFKYPEEHKRTPYYIMDWATNSIVFFPVPQVGGRDIEIEYSAQPERVTQYEDILPIPLDYEEILVVGLCERIAKAQEDPALANAYVSDFADLLWSIKTHLMNQDPEYPHTRDVLK